VHDPRRRRRARGGRAPRRPPSSPSAARSSASSQVAGRSSPSSPRTKGVLSRSGWPTKSKANCPFTHSAPSLAGPSMAGWIPTTASPGSSCRRCSPPRSRCRSCGSSRSRPGRPRAQRLQVAQRARRAGLHALPAEGARRVLQEAVELDRDPCVEAPVLHADRVVALLLRAHAHAAVAGDAVLVVPQDEGVVVGRGELWPESGPPEPPRARIVAIDERRQLLRGVARERVDVDLPVLDWPPAPSGPAVHLQLPAPGGDPHAPSAGWCTRPPGSGLPSSSTMQSRHPPKGSRRSS
jgi:hypothetical protein